MELIELIAKDREKYLSILKSNSHALILESQDEKLLESFSRYLACNIFCKNDTPCLKCAECLKVINNNSLDLFVYDKPIMVDSAKEIVDNLYIVPAENDYKIFILHNFDKVSERVQNKLLKSIEEPPKFVKFILLTSNMSNILPTVRSRCEKYSLQGFKLDELMNFIQDEREDLKLYAIENSKGNLCLAQDFLQSKYFNELFDLTFDMLLNMKRSSDALKYCSNIIKYKENFVIFIKLVQNVLFDVVKYQNNALQLIDNKSHLEKIKLISNDYTCTACVKIIQYLDEMNEKMQFNANTNLQIDAMLLYILEVKYKCKK